MINPKANHENPFFADPALWSSSSDIVHPIKVDETGAFLSYDLSHRVLHRRSLSSKSKFLTFYEMHYKGQPLKFNLSLNNNLLAPGFVSERRYGGIADAKIQSHTYNSCHMIGEVQSRTLKGGLAALSTCDGLVSTEVPHPQKHSRSCEKSFFFFIEKVMAKVLLRAAESRSHCVGLMLLWMG